MIKQLINTNPVILFIREKFRGNSHSDRSIYLKINSLSCVSGTLEKGNRHREG